MEASETRRPAPLDRALATLKEAFPGWRIWYVPLSAPQKGARWCAHRLPTLQADTAEHLAEYMLDLDERYSVGPYDSDEEVLKARLAKGQAPTGGL